LVDWDELTRWETIDKALNLGNPDPVETYSSSEHIYTDLDIPTDATGTVGTPHRAKRTAKSGDEDEHRISSADRPARTRTRTRRRTRGGKPLTGHPESHPESAAAAEDTESTPATEAEAGEHTARRRRRRRPRKTEAATAG
jgi:hypothetical protein